ATSPLHSPAINAGAADSNAASNALTTIMITTVPASTSRARTASPPPASRHPRNEPRKSTANAASNKIAATNPRSDTYATQSLLGHGFAVIPSSAIDGSPPGANFT